jgi:hypothetical protein
MIADMLSVAPRAAGPRGLTSGVSSRPARVVITCAKGGGKGGAKGGKPLDGGRASKRGPAAKPSMAELKADEILMFDPVPAARGALQVSPLPFLTP